MEIHIDGIGAMKHGDTRTFGLMNNGRPGDGFVIRYHEGYYAYLNKCCHWPVSLDLGDGDFFYAATDRITCKTHGAVYRPETGLCEFGPCVNAQLESYSVRVQGDELWVTVPD